MPRLPHEDAAKLAPCIYIGRSNIRGLSAMTFRFLFTVAFVATTTLAIPAAHAQETVSVEPFRNVELRGGGHILLRRGSEQRVTLLRGSSRFTRVHVRENGQLVIDT